MSAVLLALVAALAAELPQWQSVASASELSFEASYDGEPVPGRFERFSVTARFEPTRPAEGAIHVVVDLDSVATGNGELDAELRKPVWFDSASNAQALYRTDAIRVLADGSYVASGQLHLKGSVAPVSLRFVWEDGGDQASLRGAFRMRGASKVRRGDFDVGSGEWADSDLVAQDVLVRFRVTLQPRR